jgi:hypothetical protein
LHIVRFGGAFDNSILVGRHYEEPRGGCYCQHNNGNHPHHSGVSGAIIRWYNDYISLLYDHFLFPRKLG